MPDYSKGKIYTVRCHSNDKLVYVGSTIQSLAVRFGGHKCGKSCSLYKYINNPENNTSWNEWYMELYELHPCDSKIELMKREGEVIREIATINKVGYYIDVKDWRKQYYEKNKEAFTEKSKEYFKEYYETNKESIAKNTKDYHEQNKQYLNERHKEYYKANKQALTEKKKEYCKANKHTLAEKDKEYREANKQAIADYMKEYYKNNKGKDRNAKKKEICPST